MIFIVYSLIKIKTICYWKYIFIYISGIVVHMNIVAASALPDAFYLANYNITFFVKEITLKIVLYKLLIFNICI